MMKGVVFPNVLGGTGAMSRSEDWVSVVEAAYRLDLSGAAFTKHLAEVTLPLRGSRFGVFAYTFETVDGAVSIDDIAVAGVPPEAEPSVLQGVRDSPPDGYLPFLQAAQPYGTASSNPELSHVMRHVQQSIGHLGVRDAFGLVARLSWGSGLLVSAPLPERHHVGPAEHRRLGQIAAHLEAGARLRRSLTEGELSLDDADVEAVMEPDGKVLHAAGDGTGASARELLRDAARSIDRARGSLRRRDPDGSLALWRGMVDGRWSLVDHFDHDGRRFVVARKNSTGMEDPRALTERESQVAHLVSLGKTNAEAAYALGLSDTTVRNYLGAAMRKLGLTRRRELVRLAMGPLRTSRLDSTGGELRVSSTVDCEMSTSADLTAAERAVLALIVRGLGDRDIAKERAVSASTVAKQVTAVLRKHAVSSREELLRAVLGRADATDETN